MSRTAIALAGVLIALAAGAGGYWRGHGAGQAAEVARQDAKTVQQLREQLTAHADLVKRSGAASRGMRTAVAQLEKAQTQTTTEMADALTTTADSRAGCVFPDDVVRGLQAARDGAAKAASSGIRGALPATTPGSARAASRSGSP